MLFKLLSCSAIMAVVCSSAAYASTDQLYFKGAVGYGFSKGKATTRTLDKDGKETANETKSTRNKGAILEAALGYRVSDEFRAELSLMHKMKNKFSVQAEEGATQEEIQKTKEAALSHSFTALMVNGYYDFNNTSDFTPYVGAGLGYAAHNFSQKDFKSMKAAGVKIKSKNGFALSAAAGVAYKISDSVTAELGYKMFYAPASLAIQQPEVKAVAGVDAMDSKPAIKSVRAIAASTTKIKVPALTHSVNLGLRVSF